MDSMSLRVETNDERREDGRLMLKDEAREEGVEDSDVSEGVKESDDVGPKNEEEVSREPGPYLWYASA